MSMATPGLELPLAKYAACSGCALCLLVCPIWRRTRDIELTPLGGCKSLQHGAAVADLAALAQWCSLCGACAPVCPERIDLVGLMRSLRHQLQLACDMLEPAIAEPLIAQPAVRQHLGGSNLLVIEPRRYHADYEQRVQLYDGLRRETGCMLNLDLQRIAIPARLPAPDGHAEGDDDLGQARWIVQGLKVERIVVEDPADRSVFERLAAWPVVSVDELARGAC